MTANVLDIGILKVGKVTSINENTNEVSIKTFSNDIEYTAAYPGYMASSHINGLWNGIAEEDIVLGSVGHGNKFFILNKIANFDVIGGIYDEFSLIEDAFDGFRLNLKPGSWLMRSPLNTSSNAEFMTFFMSPGDGILIGNKPYASISLDYTDATNAAFSIQAKQKYSFSQGDENISGAVLRRQPGNQVSSYVSVFDATTWDDNLYTICLDPSQQKTIDQPKRNPPLTESRKIVYEFSEDYNVESDSLEVKKQTTIDKDAENARIDSSRRKRKNDVLSLSLVAPNYLIENIEGTVVDAFGEILDLNRIALPVGKDGLVKIEGTEKSFKEIREIHRKGLALHWELNARKTQSDVDSLIEVGTGKDYGNTEDSYKRERSRLFIDIDKEGQFKINVPASSEKGNVAVLARYENWSTVNPTFDAYYNRVNYDTIVDPDSGKQDILLDGFGIETIDIVGNEQFIPVDRITESKMKVGTAFHDISTTCCYPKYADGTELYQKGPAIFAGPEVPLCDAVVTTSINIDGDNANAGGRSGTITIDGMISASIGANTVDRQSLWLDLAGGSILRFGRDLNDRSIVAQMDGSVFIQVGGDTPDKDKRFKSANNTANIDSSVEIRLMLSSTQYHRFVLDKTGVHVKSAGDITMEANNNIKLNCGGHLYLGGEEIVHHAVPPDCETSYVPLTVLDDVRPNASPQIADGDVYYSNQ